MERGIDRIVRGNDQKRVAVRWRARDHLGGDIGGGTRPVLDDERLTEPLRQPFRHEPRRDVDRLAGGKADDDAHRPVWIGLRIRDRRDGRQGGSPCREMPEAATLNDHAAHSAMIWFARITSPQRRTSSLMKAAVSAGVLPSGSTLSARKRCCTSDILSTSMVALAI